MKGLVRLPRTPKIERWKRYIKYVPILNQEDICSENIQPGEQLSGKLWDPLGSLEGVFV
jgi:hypothetical protein